MSWWRWKWAWTYGRALTHISCVALAKFFTLRSLRFLTHKTSTTTQSCRAVVGIALGEVPAHGEGSARPGELAYAWVITGVNDLMPLDASSSTFTITMTLRGQAGTTPVSEAQSDGWQAPRPPPSSPPRGRSGTQAPPPQPGAPTCFPQLHPRGELVGGKAPVPPHLFWERWARQPTPVKKPSPFHRPTILGGSWQRG